jgi:hypothetical protein
MKWKSGIIGGVENNSKREYEQDASQDEGKRMTKMSETSVERAKDESTPMKEKTPTG